MREIQALKTEELNKQIEPLQQQLSSEYAQLNKLNSEYYEVAKEKHDYLNEIGGYGVLARSQGMPNYNEMFRSVFFTMALVIERKETSPGGVNTKEGF